LSNKFFGPYKILEKIGTMAYRLELPSDSSIHPVFHVSQLKQYHPNYTLVFSTLPMLTDIQAAAAQPDKIIDRRLVKKGNNAVTQLLVSWTGLPSTSTTWEDYNILKTRFPDLLGSKQHRQRGELSHPRRSDEGGGVFQEARHILLITFSCYVMTCGTRDENGTEIFRIDCFRFLYYEPFFNMKNC
jgi:hypothetical protein